MAALIEAAPKLYFPPRLVLHFSRRLGLTQEQQNKIRLEMLTTRRAVLTQQMRAERARISVEEIAAGEPPDLDAMFALLDTVAAAQAEIAKLHLQLWQRTRAALTPKQRATFDDLRVQARFGFGLRPRDDGPPEL